MIVSDDGPGMTAAVRRRVFELHFTTKATGTGIGLYVARSIVEAHGGEILAESGDGRGSTFRLRLPRQKSGD
jgi:signal transduction histidine kinase